MEIGDLSTASTVYTNSTIDGVVTAAVPENTHTQAGVIAPNTEYATHNSGILANIFS